VLKGPVAFWSCKMLHRIPLGLALLLFGCKGEFIESELPGGVEPPATNVALAFRFGGPGTENLTGMAADAGGAVYVAGSFTAAADFDPGSGITALNSLGGADGFLAKYSATGALLWVSRVGGSGEETVTSLVRDASGNLYVGGGFTGSTDFDPGPGLQVLNSAGAQDGFVAKFSSAGELLWARRFGGVEGDEVAGVAVDAAGRVYAAGRFSGQADALPTAGGAVTGDGSAADGFLVAFDAAGTLRWAQALGGSLEDAVTALSVSGAGSVTLAGVFRGSANFSRTTPTPVSLTSLGGADVFLASYSDQGALQWVRGIGGLDEESIPPGGLALDPQGGAAVLGRFSGSVDFDPGPGTAGKTSISPSDLFLVRFDATGTFASVATVGGLGTASGQRALSDVDGSALITGAFSGPVDFDPGNGTSSLSSLGEAGATDVFVARYSAAGSLVWVSRFGEVTSEARPNGGTALALDPSGGVLVAGRFFGSPDFDPGNTSFRLLSVGEADAFVVRLTSAGTLATIP
jgi:hypothetical protein